MYSLPITTYSDYWRRTRVWTSYLGGLAVFAAGTRYSTLGSPDITQTLLLPYQLTQTMNPEEIADVGFPENWQSPSRTGTVNQGITEQAELNGGIKEGVAKQALTSEGTGVNTSRILLVDQEIPYETQYIESDKLLPGVSKIQEKGEKGILRQAIKTLETDGQPINQQIQSSFVLLSPKKEVIIRNTKPIPKKKVVIPSSRSISPAIKTDSVDIAKLDIKKTLQVEATAYTFTGNNTATGVPPREGLIAVDPKIIPMGTKLYIEGYGYAIAADTGGAIRGNRIDVFFSTLRQCINWGRKSVRIYVLNPT